MKKKLRERKREIRREEEKRVRAQGPIRPVAREGPPGPVPNERRGRVAHARTYTDSLSLSLSHHSRIAHIIREGRRQASRHER